MHGQGREISTQCHPVSVEKKKEKEEVNREKRMRFPFDGFPLENQRDLYRRS